MPTFVASDNIAELKTVGAARSALIIVSEYCPERPYVELEVPSDIEIVTEVTFKTVSHDQGYSDEAEGHGSYKHTHSWFEIAVVTPSYHFRGHRQQLQSNVHADANFHEHINAWKLAEEEDESRRHWFGSIRPGDTVQIIPKAHHKGWRNFVSSAEIILTGCRRTLQLGDIAAEPDLLEKIEMSKFGDQQGFLYQPLLQNVDQIRLISLHGGSSDDTLCCTLEYTILGDSKYEALSYCWGDFDEINEISISNHQNPDSKAVRIKSNLADCLRHLRPTHSTGSRLIWVDALCIDQNNLQERADQVTIMPRIYSQAQSVLVWLGRPAGSVETNIDFARTVLNQSRQPLNHRETLDSMADHNTEDLRHDFLTHHRTDSKVLEFDYFRRVWVLQECFNAKKISVICGHMEIPWAWLLRINECLNWIQLTSGNPGSNVVMPTLFASLFEYRVDPSLPDEECLQYSRVPRRISILDAIISGLDLNASDPRDKIFALLHLSDLPDEALPIEVRPDYTKSVGQVFADFTRWWIVQYSSLQILSAVHASVGRTWQKLSSRQSDFGRGNRATWCLWHDGKTNWAHACLALQDSSITPLMHASADTSIDMDLLEVRKPEDAMTLSLRGRRVATVAEIKPFPFFAVASHVQLEHTNPSPAAITNCERKNLYDVYNHVFDPLSFTQIWKGNTQPHHTAQDFESLTPAETRARLIDHSSSHTPWTRSSSGGIGPAQLDFDCHQPSLLVTDNRDAGSGLCPAVADAGDIVVVLHGGGVPYLLRPVQQNSDDKHVQPSRMLDHYQFIGECYVPKIMEGQVFEETNVARYPAEIFHLI